MATIDELVKKRYSTSKSALLHRDNFYEHKGKLYFTEKRPGEAGLNVEVFDVPFFARSKYQEILVVDTIEEGNLMVIDGMTMVSDNSESWYHEFMAHVPLFVHPNPERVLICGGGDGGLIREVVKHEYVQNVVQCDIDELVTKVSERYFPNLTTQLYHPKVKLVFDDAKKFLNQVTEPFDVVFYDLCDPDVGPTQGMFDDVIFRKTYDSMADGGILVMQSESPLRNREWLKAKKQELKEHFNIVEAYQFPMPIYPGGVWSALFCMKGQQENFLTRPIDPSESKAGIIEGDERFGHYNKDAHKAAFLALRDI